MTFLRRAATLGIILAGTVIGTVQSAESRSPWIVLVCIFVVMKCHRILIAFHHGHHYIEAARRIEREEPALDALSLILSVFLMATLLYFHVRR